RKVCQSGHMSGTRDARRRRRETKCVRVFFLQTTRKCLFTGTFRKHSDGLEPSTPFLPWRFRSVTRVHARSLATHILLQIAPFEGPEMRRETPRVSVLVCPFYVRDLSVLKTPNGGTWMRVISTLNLKPAPGSSSPEAAAHERYRVGLHAVADLARSSGRRAAASSAARPSCRAPWSLQASSCASA